MKTTAKKTMKSIVGIMFTLLCVFLFVWTVSADDFLISEEGQEEHSSPEYAEQIYEDNKLTGFIESDTDWYHINCFQGSNGYYSFEFKTLSMDEEIEDLEIYICDGDDYGMYPLWSYKDKPIKSIKTKIGRCKGDSFYVCISGPSGLKYQFSIKHYKAKNWETERNYFYYEANPIEFNTTMHGNTCWSYREGYDYDYYELDVPSTGILDFEMDRTPKNNHTVMIYNEKLKQVWKTKVTSGSHISKKFKVTAGKYYIKIYGTNYEQYDFKVTHKQTTNVPGKPIITKTWSLKKSFKVVWKNPGGTFSGYQIQYSKDKKFKTGVSSKWIGGKKTTKIVISGLEKSYYYIRIRTFNKINGKTYYSPWSEVAGSNAYY